MAAWREISLLKPETTKLWFTDGWYMPYFVKNSVSFNRNAPFKISDEGTKLEGETCGACFSPSTNFTCGTCIDGLECVPDENAAMLPDLPSRCRSPQSKIFSKN